MNLDITNADRIARAENTLVYYSFEKGEAKEDSDQRTDVVDLIADLMHLCEKNGHVWDNITSIANHHFTDEQEEQS